MALSHWAPVTFSPQTVAALGSEEEAALLRLCSRGDGGLNRVARTMAGHQASGGTLLDTEEVSHELRAAGVPQVWPRAWAIVGNPTLNESREGLSQWLSSFGPVGERRCGIGSARLPDRRRVISVIAVDAIADLDEIPTQARLGQWIQLRAQLLEPATAAEVIVLGPRGTPRTVPVTLTNGRVKAAFSVDAAGPWKVQVLPTLADGPRPALEAMIFVDQTPPDTFQAARVPGEEAANDESREGALLQMLNAARRSERLRPLARLRGLDVAAQMHTQAMMETRKLAHDVGLGSPTARLDFLGVRPSMAGENVAHALNIVRAHRALWDSPSHRSNLLHPRFTHVGIGVTEDADGSVWVCEVFAEFDGR